MLDMTEESWGSEKIDIKGESEIIEMIKVENKIQRGKLCSLIFQGKCHSFYSLVYPWEQDQQICIIYATIP
jgi:hypothetical protein